MALCGFGRFHLFTLALIGLCQLPVTEGWTAAEETTLRGTLSTGYDISVRPEEVAEVNVAFQMLNIEDINIKAQTFSVSGWWVLEWNDPRLTWTPASNGNIEYLQFDKDDVWKPAIQISNSVSDLTAIDEDTIPMRIKYNGDVQWHPPGIFTTGCEMDTTYFPFDIQQCGMTVTSVGYTLNEVNINSTDGVITSFYHENGDWEVLEMWKDRDTYNEYGKDYARITFSVKVQRLNTYHWMNVIMPVCVSGILVVFVFLLPVDSGEKMGYSLTCLLTYVVLLTLISADMPTTADHTPILEVYLIVVLLLSGFTVVCCIVSIKLYQAPEDEKIPHFVVVATKKCWPLVDWRKSTANKKHNKINPAEETTKDPLKYKKDGTVLSPMDFAEKEKGLRTPVRRMSVASTTSDPDYSEELIDGQVCSLVMDKILFRFFGVVIPVFTLILLIVLITGHS